MLFKNIKLEIHTKLKASNYLNTLTNQSQLYAAILNPNDEFWKDHPHNQRIKEDLFFLALFNIAQARSLLMATYTKFEDDFHTILRWIKNFSMRYNIICHEHTGEQENLYSKIVVEINNGCSRATIKTKLLSLYPNDERFRLDFTDKTISTEQSNKKARYILTQLEKFHTNNAIDQTALTIEHILPNNPSDEWIDYFGDNWNVFNQCLGNMALVSNTLNKQLGQKDFIEKQKYLKNTQYALNKTVADYPEWNSDSIESRQRKLAEIAVQLWSIN